jgi:hypothetical protein
MPPQRVGGIISLQVDGVILNAKGHFTYNYGVPKRQAVVGSDGRLHGFKEEPQPGFIEGAITDDGSLDTISLASVQNATVTLQLANEKVCVLRNAFYTGEGTGNTEEGEIPVRFEGEAEEVPA